MKPAAAAPPVLREEEEKTEAPSTTSHPSLLFLNILLINNIYIYNTNTVLI